MYRASAMSLALGLLFLIAFSGCSAHSQKAGAGTSSLPQGASGEVVSDVCAPYVDTPPKIDGVLKGDQAWTRVAVDHRGVMAGWTHHKAALPDQQRIGYVCWDKDHLYIAMQAFTPDIFKLAASPGGSVFTGDCLEIHLVNPDGAYFHIGADIEGKLEGFRRTEKHPLRLDLTAVEAMTEFGDNYWSLEMAIPWELIEVSPRGGLQLGFTLSANRAYQGKGISSTIQWGESFGVRNMKPSLLLTPPKQ